MQMSGIMAHVQPRAVTNVAPQSRALRGVVGRKQVLKPVGYKKDAGDRMDDAADKAKRGVNDAADSLDGWRRKGEGKAEEVGNKAANAADKLQNKLSNAGDKLQDKMSNAGDRLQNKAEEFGDKFSDAAEDTKQKAKKQLQTDSGVATWYSLAGLVMLGVEVYKLWRPEAAVGRVFGFAMDKLGSQISALIGTLNTAPFMMQMMAVLSIPALFAFFIQARQASEGNLSSDSSMRLNFGLGVASLMSTFTLFTSPLLQNMGGPAIAWSSVVILLNTFAVYKGVVGTHEFGSLLNKTLGGVVSTVKRVLTPKSWEGTIYSVCCALASATVFWAFFGNAAVGDLFGAGIADLVPAHREVINLLSRAISAQLIFIAVSFAALKELADKKALASPTARLLNLGMTLTLLGFGILVRGGEANGMYSDLGTKLLTMAGSVASAMLVATGFFTIYPASKSEVMEDTPAEAY